MTKEEEGLFADLSALHEILLGLWDGLRPDTEYLRDDVHRLLTEVDNLRAKVDKEGLLIRDKRELQAPPT